MAPRGFASPRPLRSNRRSQPVVAVQLLAVDDDHLLGESQGIRGRERGSAPWPRRPAKGRPGWRRNKSRHNGREELTSNRPVTQDDSIVAEVSKKHRDLYYLLPGQGRGARKRFLRNLIVAVIVGCLTAGRWRAFSTFLNSKPILAVSGLTVRRGTALILDDVSWTVRPGEHWVIVGANGSGKTSLLSALTGYLTPTSGEVEVLSQRYGRSDWRELRKRIGLVSSAIRQRIPPDEPALETVVSGKYAMIDFWGKMTAADRRRARRILRSIECEESGAAPVVVSVAGGTAAIADRARPDGQSARADFG